jgi:hypothetical protein
MQVYKVEHGENRQKMMKFNIVMEEGGIQLEKEHLGGQIGYGGGVWR